MPPVDVARAREIAEDHIRSMGEGEDLRALGGLCIGWTTERKYGWAFTVTTRKFLETGLMEHAIVGSTVFLVDATGEILELPTALPLDHILAAWDVAYAEGRAFDPWLFIRDPRNHPH